MKAKIAAGSVVLNQDPAQPMSGVVISPPDGLGSSDFVWVDWSDGTRELEAPDDLALTAKLFVTLE